MREENMSRITITLTDSNRMAHVPLAALGYALRRASVLEPLTEVTLPIKVLTHTVTDKLLEALVLILAGGRATNQANLWLRPNRGLAEAWGQTEFAEQPTLADTLDAFEAGSVTQLRHAFEVLTQQHASATAHDFRSGCLWVDDDLTGLPASRRAEGSTKGYFSGEKTVSVGNSLA
jgi:hypothetical protein